MLIDTSGSMTQEPKSNLSGTRTDGDGTNPYNGHYTYYTYGRDLDGTNNRVTLVDADALPNGTDVRFNVNFNYHPNLVYVPKSQVLAMTGHDDYNTAVDTVRGWGDFAEYNQAAGDLSPSEFGVRTGKTNQFYSVFKYPNDSRMYILKNVMYRLLHDATIYSKLRMGLAAYNQTFGMATGLGFHRERYWRRVWRGWPIFEYVWIWDWRSVSIFWTAGSSDTYRGAKLHEPFESTTYNDNTDTPHLNNLRKWFDGESGGESLVKNAAGTITGSRELRADAYTPLADSIYNTDRRKPDSVWQIFETAGVIQNYCQQNWLIVLTDGEDYWDRTGATSITAVQNLVRTPPGGSENRKIKVFVIGFVDKIQQSGLAATLDSMAAVGGTKSAYFAKNMDELFDALRNIFAEIQSVSSGLAPLVSAPRSSEDEDTEYTIENNPLVNRQWEGSLTKIIRTIEGENVERKQSWEAGKQLSDIEWYARNIYTAFQNLPSATTNLFPFTDSDSEANLLVASSDILGIPDKEDRRSFIQWLRGKDAYDEEEDKDELHKLLDISNSGLVKVGSPGASIWDPLYAQFRETHKNRDTVVYVQSNAGMLHGFDDDNGNESFAFVPPNVLANGRLRGLRWEDWGTQYENSTTSISRFLLDGPLIVEDVIVDGAYRTLLMGLLGFGGAGMYVLDVTDPSPGKAEFLWAVENSVYGFNEGKVLLKPEAQREVLVWEKGLANNTLFAQYAHTPTEGTISGTFDYRRLRRTVGAPFIGQIFIKDSALARPEWKWAFLMPSGASVGVTGDSSSQGAVFIGSMKDGAIIKSFDTGAPVTSSVVALAGSLYREARTFFAADAAGKLYKGDLTKTAKENWSMYPVLLFPNDSPGISRSLLGIKLDQQIWVCAGTGDITGYLATASDDVNYFASANITGVQSVSPLEVKDEEEHLLELDPEDGEEFLDLSENGDRKGWFITFDSRERMSSPPYIMNGYVFFWTFIPDDDVCSDSGDSRLYLVNVKSGLSGWNPEEIEKKYKEYSDLKVSGFAVRSLPGGNIEMILSDGTILTFPADTFDDKFTGSGSPKIEAVYWKER
ncbi:MAG: hypothetical protein EOM62_15770 [Bacteroidia bacterium]|nr:hypothetical protein [Bacteroidia bacterium]